MTASDDRPRAPRLSLALFLAALSATAARAQTITAVGSIHCVGYEGAPEGAGVIGAGRLQRYLEEEIGLECDPARIAENLAARYRVLGYVPTIDITCDERRLDARIRARSHRIASVTFDPSELATLGVQAAAIEGETTLHPLPAEAPREVVRGLMQSRAGDLYSVARYRADRSALARLGYALLFIPGLPAPPDCYPQGALLIQSRSPLPEEGTAPQRK